MAVAVNADALEALDLAGFLETPRWALRLEAKLDIIIERLPAKP
ncbi:MAG TPA: hypothetical protein VFC12_06695 [Terriglobales bacterium]|jgi:hypothetical protein|nr:hypothetical protein [Terriglobales bacterium]